MSRLAGGAFAAATGALTAVTLMACYGLPPCDESDDKDGDGHFTYDCGSGDDCNDDDASIHPGAVDPEGDGIDQNCDGVDGQGGAGGQGGEGQGGGNVGGEGGAGGGPVGGG